jgi:hypothetical protein
MVICLASVAGHHGAVIDEVQQATGMTSKDDLLLGALDDRCSVDIKCLLELGAGLSKKIY